MLLNVPTALGHMLIPSAQRWTDKQCYRRIPYVLTIGHKLTMTACMCPGVGFDPTLWDVGIRGIKCSISTANCFVYMAVYDLEMKLVYSFSVL